VQENNAAEEKIVYSAFRQCSISTEKLKCKEEFSTRKKEVWKRNSISATKWGYLSDKA
jgi:hypothetical protein